MKTRVLFLLVVFLPLVIAPGCEEETECPTPFSFVGTITYVNLEGGFFGIVSDDWCFYEPINLEAQYQVDGLRVQIEARERLDIVTCIMWGITVELFTVVLP